MQANKGRVLFPIGVKLVSIISVLVLLSLGAVTVLVSILSTQDVQRTAEDNNFTVNRRAGSQAESSFKSVQAAALFYLEMMDRISVVSEDAVSERDPETEWYFFNHNRNIAAIWAGPLYDNPNAPEGQRVSFSPNEKFLLANNIGAGELKAYFDSDLAADRDRMRLFNASPHFQLSLITAVFTRQGKAGIETVKVLFTADDLSDTFGTGTNSSFVITDSGDVLLHPESDIVLGGANFSSMPIVAAIQQDGNSNGRQITFSDDAGFRYFGAYYRIDGTDTVAITTIAHDTVFEAVQSITRQNLFLTAAVLFIAILCIWFFSKTISSPVRLLADAALRIEGGDFEVNLKPQTRDELGLLTESFGKMSGALNIFGRFTNKDIAIRAMRGEIKPGGLSRHATIFFSDIRGFTEKSEAFTKVFGEDASNRIVLWLNEYFTRMVQCVEKTGGVVDKYIGDAVMAHWGTAFTAGSPAADALNCVKAALMMRTALMEINGRRVKNDPGNPEIRIGCGINTGVVTAGQIGSDQRMEYTVIGDPVNLASRTEALNKPLGTDILITENTWELVGDKFITEEMPPVTVKGKEKPVRMFAVVNFLDYDGPKTLGEVRTLLGIPTPDISKVDTDAEEQKYKIQED
jgi:adenylate cyclase